MRRKSVYPHILFSEETGWNNLTTKLVKYGRCFGEGNGGSPIQQHQTHVPFSVCIYKSNNVECSVKKIKRINFHKLPPTSISPLHTCILNDEHVSEVIEKCI